LLLACLLGAVWLLRRRRYQPRHVSPRPSRGADGRLLAALGIIGAASLAWSITLTAGAPSGAYFSTLARVWELVAGASCAVLLPTISRLPAAAMRALTWAGVVCIGMAVFGYDATTPFPGYAALCPVVGAMLVIAGGSRARSLPTSLLGSRPLRWVGDASYSFYLWHWPFLVVAAGYVGHPLPAYQNLLVVTAALALSVLTYRYVENPFRRARLPLLTRRRGVALYPVAIAATLVTCMVADHLVHREVAEAASNPGIEMHQRGSTYHGTSYAVSPTVRRVRASVAAARHDQAVPGDLRPGLLDLRASIPDVGECDYLEDVHRLCKRGAKGEDDGGDDKVIVLFGDSHARSWIPAVDVVAKQRGWSAYYLVRPACTEAAITPDRVKGAGARDECLSWRQWAMDEIGQLHPDVTVLTSYVPRGVVKPDGDVAHDDHEVAAMFGTGLRETIDDLRDHTGRLVLVGDVPGVKEPTGECLGGRGATLGDCASPPSARGELMRDTTQRVAKRAGVPYIDPTPWFCFDDLCPSVIGSFVAYRDSEHISVPYSRHLSDVLGDALLPSRSR
ncbi:MAG: acyltransferase family protein, partial [Nocardioidaceae bacterium]